MGFVKTSRAKSKIKNALKEEKKRIGNEGKEILERKLRHIKIPFDDIIVTQLIRFFHLKTSLDLYYQFGAGILNKDIRSFANQRNQGWYGFFKNKITGGESQKYARKVIKKSIIWSFGSEKQQLDYKLAKCCTPISGDEVLDLQPLMKGLKFILTTVQTRYNYALGMHIEY